MVNIPPLLSSTPPPIDFGEDEDVLPTPLDVGDDFGDFLSEDDTKSSEPLPSPIPPSVCDLPPDEEDLKNQKTNSSSTSTDYNTNKDCKNNIKFTNFTEAFNFNVKNANLITPNVYQDETKILKDKENKYQPVPDILKMETNKCPISKQKECLNGKSIKDSTFESLNGETNVYSAQNVVSIEDIEDDLSDDELYSPKTPKNFMESDNLNDYFKIEEVKTLNIEKIDTKQNAKDVNSKSFEFLENNESSPPENANGNELKSISANNFIQNNFDMPPPLRDDLNSIVDGDDDFGDFADFQEIHFVNNSVPVNDINFKKCNNNELNHLNDLTNQNQTEDYNKNESKYLNDSGTLDQEINDLSSSSSTYSIKSNTNPEEMSKQNSSNLKTAQEEILTNKSETSKIVEKTYEDCEDIFYSNKNKQSLESLSSVDNHFDNITAAEVNDNFGNFTEYSDLTQDCKGSNAATIFDKNQDLTKLSKNTFNEDEDFDDFADFESHQDLKKSNEKENSSSLFKDSQNVDIKDNDDGGGGGGDDDDDDFGDFNTAEPLTPTASNVTFTKTSQNAYTETLALPSHNLNERILKILQLMFIPTTNPADENSAQTKTNKIKDIPFTSIDAAKALEYQWLISDTRHSFIRSLGIDSRNILYGDNWNPLLPRFAANLSFNPLKPMKPVQFSSSTGDATSMLEPLSINSSEETREALEITSSNKKEVMDMNWHSPATAERSIEALTEQHITPGLNSPAVTSMSYVSSEPPSIEPISLAILDNTLDKEGKFSNTPPISEMESVTTFSTPLPAATMDIDLPQTQIAKNINDFDLNEVEESLKNTLNINEVVVTSTFTGSFKETHIYTPTKTNDFETKQTIATTPSSSSSPTKASPIDFDYEKAAMGVIIDETVVKKEYRDVEYNPPFSMDSVGKSITSKPDLFETNTFVNSDGNILSSNNIKVSFNDISDQDEPESNDDFSEFQSVSSEAIVSSAVTIPKITNPLNAPKTAAASHGGMILSPAILIPQAISMENQKPKIEWGDSTASINPEELARIEELFPEPKSLKSSNSSQKSTPTHQVASTPSISATVANKELEGNINDDDDYWSDFVSVTVTNNVSTNRTGGNNNILTKSPASSPFKQRSPAVSHRMPTTTTATNSNSNNDEEWSDFVSSAPPSQQANTYRVPQFNSGAWQNANFYNNPLSMYHKGPLNISAAAATTANSTQKSIYNNNNNYNIPQRMYQPANNMPCVMMASDQQTPNNAYQQQIHVMQNFSTARAPTPERLSAAAGTVKNNQFQTIGSAKVAPNIALIPDLGFVAPAIPTHTSFINSLPKPSINTKK